MGTENRRLYSVGDTADDFLRPYPPHLTYFTALHAQLLWTSSAIRRLRLMAQGHLFVLGFFIHCETVTQGRRIHNGKPTLSSV